MKGVGFGITSGTITTLGLMIGLYASTNSRLVVLGGILTIAIADAFSDALGIHISEESVNENSKHVWASTFSTFFVKFFTAMLFLIPVFFLELKMAIVAGIILGFILLGVFSYFIAKGNKENPVKVVSEHYLIAVAVIVLTYFLGEFVGTFFV